MPKLSKSEGVALPAYLKASGQELHLTLKVLPRASRNEIAGPMGDALRIKVTAPPVDSAANEAVIRFLAEQLGCSRSALHLVRGHTSRLKLMAISGLSPSEVIRRLQMAAKT